MKHLPIEHQSMKYAVMTLVLTSLALVGCTTTTKPAAPLTFLMVSLKPETLVFYHSRGR